MFIINFHKGKAYPFVQMPLNELTDSVVDGDFVLTNEILNLREMILTVPVTVHIKSERENYEIIHRNTSDNHGIYFLQ